MALETMMRATRELPDHVLDAVDAVETVHVPEGPFSACTVVGMGGSSIGGALAAAHLDQDASIPVTVTRDHALPGFVGDDTLVVATSYSGTTTETLDAARAAVQQGATVLGVTTGGELEPLVDEAGGSVVKPPEGFEPRAALGWLFAANYAFLATALEAAEPEQLRAAAKRVADRLDELAPEGGPADDLAQQLGDGPVGVVGHDVWGTVARRWAGELSENAKRLAFHAELPEMAHNQLVGWDGTPGDATLVALRRDDEGALEEARFEFLTERADEAGATVVEARVPGQGLEALLSGILLGDLVSLHVARREGTDPEPVDVIDDLKARLAEAQERSR